jgi:hypothetical protein
MSAFYTLGEILIWQYGSDLLSLRLLSHEKVRRAEAPKHFELRPITMIHRSLCRQYVALSAAVSTVS